MPVVINEFEILHDPPAPSGTDQPPAPAPQASELKDHELLAALRRLRHREARVRAT